MDRQVLQVAEAVSEPRRDLRFWFLRLNGMAACAAMIVFLFGLALFAYTGTYSRFWADDYCYSATVKQLGVFRGLLDWYRNSGNRLSTLVVVAFTDLFGWRSIQFIPLGILAICSGAWIFFLRQVRKMFRWTIAGYWLVLLALVEVYFVTLLAPDRLQTIYWRMGTFHYTLPMPLLLINLGYLAACYNKSGKHIFWVMAVSGLLGLFAAGLSETFAAMQTGALLLGIAAILVWVRGEARLRGVRLLAAPLAGSVMMMVVMMLAPANAWRQAVMPPPDNPLMVIPYSMRFAGDFILYTIRGQIIPFLVYLGIVGLIAFLCVPVQIAPLRPRAAMAGAVFALVVMYVLIVCSFAPSAYADLAYPAGRALMPGGFILLVGLGVVAGLLGLAARRWLLAIGPGRWMTIAAAVLLAVFSLYPLRAITVVRSDIARLSVRAERWDARNAEIRQALAVGMQDIQVRQVDVVQTLEDMGPDPTQWVNVCARDFYGARSITARP